MLESTFGRYTLHSRIDVGGMAEVFKGVQRGAAGFERVVAIKRILPNIAADAGVIQMFIEEAKLAVQLSHPNIAQIFDLGEVEGSYFIAMEYVDGHSLKTLWERLAARGERLPAAAVCFMLTQIADALHYAHFAEDPLGQPLGLIHRDVSPANILLSFGGEVKVIDFGLAKATSRASQTGHGVVKGKLAYLSPEQAHGRPIDRRSDLFSLGICAWELVTARRAFRRDDDRETVLAIRAGRIDRPSVHASVPPELELIVERALAPDPDRRYGTARELRDDLSRFADQAGMSFDRAALATLMRKTFPERFAEEPGADGAIALVQRKTKHPPPPSSPPPAVSVPPTPAPAIPAPAIPAVRAPEASREPEHTMPLSETVTLDELDDVTEQRGPGRAARADDTEPVVWLPKDTD